MKSPTLAGPAALLLLVAACAFEPDLSRFPPCGKQGACPEGWTCFAREGRCLPDCGERGPCTATEGALTLEPLALPAGTEASPYLHPLQARGGTPPYTFHATEPLPPGLALDEEGTLSGTPGTAGNFSLSVEVRDQATPQARASERLSLRVRPLLRLAGPSVLAEAPLGKSYSEQLSATGGLPPYRFELIAGQALPKGLSLSAAGTLAGAAESLGTTRFEVRVRDADTPPQEALRPLSLTTISPTSLLRVTSQAVPDGRANTEYSCTLRHTGNTGSVTWTLEAGMLPPGLVLNTSSGLLSGKPTSPGTSTFTLSARDSLGSDSRTFSLQVY